MAVVSMRELLEAGVHFGHQTRRWNPKMKRFIFSERGGIYIIDLQQTQALLEEAHDFARNLAERNGTILFVGTKKQAQDAVEEQAKRVGMPYVSHRWLGGLLTNWRTISDRIDRLHDLRRQKEEGQLELLPAKERIAMLAELEKLETNLGGVADLRRQPDAAFVDRPAQGAARGARGAPARHAGHRARRHELRSRRVRLRDPGNDDAIRSCSLIARVIADGIEAGKQGVTQQEMQQQQQQQPQQPQAQQPEPQAQQRRAAEGRSREHAGRGARRSREPEAAAAPDPQRRRKRRPRDFTAGGDDVTAPVISATLVKELRDQTGAGMMDAKRALVDAGRRHRGGAYAPARARDGIGCEARRP